MAGAARMEADTRTGVRPLRPGVLAVRRLRDHGRSCDAACPRRRARAGQPAALLCPVQRLDGCQRGQPAARPAACNVCIAHVPPLVAPDFQKAIGAACPATPPSCASLPRPSGTGLWWPGHDHDRQNCQATPASPAENLVRDVEGARPIHARGILACDPALFRFPPAPRAAGMVTFCDFAAPVARFGRRFVAIGLDHWDDRRVWPTGGPACLSAAAGTT